MSSQSQPLTDHASDEAGNVVALRPAPELCVGDGKPCYASAGTDDAHWRCGTRQCGSDYLSGRSQAAVQWCQPEPRADQSPSPKVTGDAS